MNSGDLADAETHSRRGAIFLDRDGTINYDSGYTYKIEDFRLLDGVLEALKVLIAFEMPLFIITNQAGIGRGYFTEREMHAFHEHMISVFNLHNISFAGIYFCPYHATAGIGQYKRESSMRKPQPGMILQAAQEHNIDLSRSYFIGDRESDILAGKSAGCLTISVPQNLLKEPNCDVHAKPDFRAKNLLDAAQWIGEIELAKCEKQIGI